ncbi:23S ribosomal RNA methyltransferase Erm [Amycolatopsis sp.]|jgi:23S rRNA (adenine-N6)-dimethyltransferase|uniref:23S ribosomal RNA methyltransferase Erm n=1 Tax=Amycolatopsis sp. TaxID=37632 RepID=UPI002E004631|nr:23S ribosomal RNA methyltransferase Erm [Amycolatopsis sp.]
MYPHPTGGRHELGQNFLTDRATIAAICAAAGNGPGAIVELGSGDGALTLPLSRLGRPITAVELDRRRADRLDRRTGEDVTVVHGDLLRHELPRVPHTIVGNIPFHLTTATLRRILGQSHWHTAVLVVQWEVARRRAGIGGASQLTAAWWPWYDFEVLSRVPARAFRPVPSVDGGVLAITRRAEPLVRERARYQDFVRQVFTGRGHGLGQILPRTGRIGRADAATWLRANGIRADALPKQLTAEHWASLWTVTALSRR